MNLKYKLRYFCIMLTAFNRFIAKNTLCRHNDKILIAVSGGMDSVVLLDLFIKAGYKVAVAHCNFKLRGNESDEDEQFVRNLAKDYGVDCFVKVCPAASYANKHKITIQEAARNLRYDFFKTLLTEKHFDKIAVAHHADDDLETFFINMARGSGITGLKGMPVYRDGIIRPLMYANRFEIEKYAKDNNLLWRNDSSNDSDKYLRNNIRHHVIPQFKKTAASVDKIYQSLTFLKEDALVFETLLNSEKRRIFKKDNGLITISFDKLDGALPGNLWLFYLIKDFGFLRKESDNIFEAVKNRSTGKRFFSENHELLVDRNKLLIQKKEVETNRKFTIDQHQTLLTEPFKASIAVINKEEVNLTDLKNSRFAFLDFEKLTFPLLLRKWKKGDRFHPYGMKGTKLLSDFFIDLKLNRFEKDNIWLLVSGGTIVWVAGHRIAGPFKINDKTKKVFSVKIL